MPCDVKFKGIKNIVKTKQRTLLSVNMQLLDEYDNSHGTIVSKEDGSIEVTVLENDGTTVHSKQTFFYCEFPGDKEMCEAKGWIPIDGSAEAAISEAQKWGTEQYRTFVHYHEQPNLEVLQCFS